jgi:lipoprotein NlpI
VILLVALLGTRAVADEEGAGRTPAQGEARARFADGNRRYAMGDYAGAEAAFRDAMRLDPELPGVYRNLGLVHLARRECDQAVAQFEAYLRLRPTGRHAERVREEIARCRARRVGSPDGGAPPAPVRREKS